MTRSSPTRIALLAAAASLATACGSSTPPPAAEPRGKTAAERTTRLYEGANACTTGTDVTLAVQQGSPVGQQVCGYTTTDPSGQPLHVYLGIAYADPPSGAHRWAPPRAPTWTELPATEFGPKCPQGKAGDLEVLGTDEGEDCLYLNVWTPKVTPSGGGDLPVMVFIHGGAFISGSGGTAAGTQPGHLNNYDGSQMVATSRNPGPPVVFVTLNYRLGVLGFLASDAMGLDGNYGLLDQTAALQWVKRNISRFGGDPAKVMIFGESAGAQSVALHLTIQADGHQDLFARAAMESNYALSYQTVAEATGKAEAFSARVACSGAGAPSAVLQCLRDLPLAAVLTAQTFAYGPEDTLCNGLQTLIPWQPVIDGVFVQTEPVQGPITKPILLGSNLTESIPFVLPWFPADPAAGAVLYPAVLSFLFGTLDTLEIHTAYELAYPRLDPLAKMEKLVTDYLWTCFNRKMARVAADSLQPAWRYHYVHHGSFSVWTNPLKATQSKTAVACATYPDVCHADELPFVFGNPTDIATVRQTFAAEEQGFTTALQSYWIEFARTGNPNASGLPGWPRHDGIPRRYLELEAPVSNIVPASDLDQDLDAFCTAIWDRIGYTVKSAFAHRPECQPTAPALQSKVP